MQQLFERAQQSLSRGATSEFNSRLLRYGQAFNLLRSSYSEYNGDPPDELIEILKQVLERYVELYKTALLQETDQICRRRIIQSISYSLMSSFYKNHADLASDISEHYQRMFRIELESADKNLMTAFATELENSIFSAIKSFEDAGSQEALNQAKRNIETAHSLCQELMKLSIEFEENSALSSFISLHDESLHHNHIHLPSYSSSNQTQDHNLAAKKRDIYKQIRSSDDLRPVVMFSWAHYLSESRGGTDTTSVSLLEEWVAKTHGDNKTPADLYFQQELLDSSYWKSWKPHHIETGSHGWLTRGFTVLQISSIEIRELDRVQSPNELGVELNEESLQILNKVISELADFQNREVQSNYLLSTIGRFQIHQRAQRLYKLYQKAAETVKSHRRDRILSSSLDEAKVEAYSMNLNNDFKTNRLRQQLVARGALEKKPYVLDRNGICLVEYSEPRTRFLEDYLPDLSKHSNTKTIVNQTYNRYLIRRACEVKDCNFIRDIEDAIRATIKQNRTKDPVIFLDTAHSNDLFEDDPEYDLYSWKDIPEGAVGVLGSIPVFRGLIYPYHALVLTSREKCIVEFPTNSGPLRVSVTPGEKANPSPRYIGDEESIDSTSTLVSISIQYALMPDQSIGTAFRLSK